MLQIVVEHVGEATMLHCAGRIVAGVEAASLKDAVACAADKRLVIIDLAQVSAIDARGLGLFVFLKTLAYALGFDLQFVNLTSRIREVIEMTGLDSVLEIPEFESGGEPMVGHAAA